jgi:TolA-binding protein
VINRALGVESGVDVEIKTIRVRDGTKFLLCSDGIYRHMSDDEIARVLAEHKDPQRAVDELKRIVHQRGADDNLTAVAVQIGRAKQTPILSIDDGLPTGRTKAAATSLHGEGAGFAKAKSRDGRIHVEFNRAGSAPDRDIGALEESAALRAEEADTERNARGSRILMYTLLVLVLIAGAFYGGLRASNVIKSRSEPNANREADLLKTGREAFERGDYRLAAAEFDSVLKRDSSNGLAHYWLGRVQLEQREYESAVRSFEEASSRQPALYDSYVQQAAAYEALGEKAKAAAALERYAEERRKQPVSLPQ